ncbi:hypothetical protein [Clostridium estertheticum]|uniref:hypothetical protein n=1 Tax=Clostridium estertheticum TaxID=238834 RepID=UPI001C0ACFC2|nr:hypothetical protein [Clostridium estertheticum]MBU3173349.1 hypothetical protein [Clostridium estertheticum]
MINGFFNGAMYIKLEEEILLNKSIQLGGKKLMPGAYVQQLGNRRNSKFEMQTGSYLKYIGYVIQNEIKTLLFTTNCNGENLDKNTIFYAFNYITEFRLLIGGSNGCKDLKVDDLEIFENVPIKFLNTNQYEQLSFII